MAAWIKKPLGMDVGLSAGAFVLDRDPAPSPKSVRSPQLSAHFYCGQTAAWINMPLGTEVGLGPDNIVLDKDPAPLPKKGAEPPPQFSAHFYSATWYGGRPQPRGFCVRWEPSPSPKRRRSPPNFRPMFVVAKRLDGSRWHLAWR